MIVFVSETFGDIVNPVQDSYFPNVTIAISSYKIKKFISSKLNFIKGAG